RINIGDAQSAMNIGEGATQGISDMLNRMRELSAQSLNDTLSDNERRSLDIEFQQLKQEIDRHTKGTQFNTQDLLSGQSPLSDGTGKFQVGPNAGGANQIDVAKSDLSPSALGIMDMRIAPHIHTYAAAGSVQNGISHPTHPHSATAMNGIGKIKKAPGAYAGAAMDGIGKANEVVISTRVNFGTQYNRLEHAYNNNENMNINTTSAWSGIEDLDFAKAAMDKARDEVLSQSAVLAQRNFQDISRNSMLALLGN
ncbi:MAG: hypothetical protein FWF63_10645, partial [Fibromonadales bacterium]|nr:hypothetical protein [Fibromonadales bacterium]